jgi:hypothetical protein
MNFKKRIEALEARLSPSYINLYMPDGSTERIRGGIDLLHLFCDGQSGQDNPVVKKIIESVESDENGHMIDLFKAMAAGPIPRGQSCDDDEAVSSAKGSAETSPELEAIMRSVGSDESGHLVELIKVIAEGQRDHDTE